MAKILAVTGKGGVGKTTTAALVIRHLKETASGPVLALDADPDANLATVLGIDPGRTIGELREETLAEMKNFPAGMSKEMYIEAGLHDLIVETPKLDMISMGRAEGPGCYCYINNLLRKFADDLMGSYDWIVMDNEAGLEHLSRRTASRIDQLFIVVNHSPLALDCARRVETLLAQLKNPVGAKGYIVNGVAEERVNAVKQKAADLESEFLGAMPFDTELDQLLFDGGSVFDLADDSQALTCVRQIMKTVQIA